VTIGVGMTPFSDSRGRRIRWRSAMLTVPASDLIEFAEFEDGTVWDIGKWDIWKPPPITVALDVVTGGTKLRGAPCDLEDGAQRRKTFFGLDGHDNIVDRSGNNVFFEATATTRFRGGYRRGWIGRERRRL